MKIAYEKINLKLYFMICIDSYTSLIPEADHTYNIFLFCCYPQYFRYKIFPHFHLKEETHL